MADMIPIFPLNLVAFPGEEIPLHIFEQRYRQLIGELKKDRSGFGIAPLIDEVIQDIGTYAVLKSVTKKHSDGKLDIVVRATRVYEIKELYHPCPGKLYDGAEVQWRPVKTSGNMDEYRDILNILTEIFSLLQIDRELPESANEFNTFDVAHFLGLPIEEEYQLLSIQSEIDRQEFILDHLHKILPVVQQMKSIREKAEQNGHFRNIL